MVDLINPQIQEACSLALPEGLYDLMSDISREVLRAQPQDLYNFISDYLSALMVARENLCIAARLCDTVCASDCKPDLDELRYIGLDDEDVMTAKKIIGEHFEKGTVNEQNLMIKIAKKTNMDESFLPAVQEAIRKAFQQNMLDNTKFYESSSDSDLDDVAWAVKHTLHLYQKTKHSQEEYDQAATKIQVPHLEDEKDVTFKTSMTSISSRSLAGSHLNLPKPVPYSIHDVSDHEHDPQFLEDSENEHATIL